MYIHKVNKQAIFQKIARSFSPTPLPPCLKTCVSAHDSDHSLEAGSKKKKPGGIQGGVVDRAILRLNNAFTLKLYY